MSSALKVLVIIALGITNRTAVLAETPVSTSTHLAELTRPREAVAAAPPEVDLTSLALDARSAVPGRIFSPTTSREFATALTESAAGDRILLQPGLTYVGPFVLRRKSGEGWVTIMSAAPPSLLPEPGVRMSPRYVAQLPKIVSSRATEPALQTEPGVTNYRLFAVEVTAPDRATSAGALIALGSGDSGQNTLASQPSNLVLDRVYVHGTPTLNFRRCIALNSGATVIIDSWISECHGRGFDSQAVAGWNGSGPYLIQNNFLEGAGENVMFGGADPKIRGALPSDIIVRGNHVFKPHAWRGVWTVKNSLELKLGRRVLIEGNVFENNWADAQTGFAVVLKSTNEENTAPWSQTTDVTFQFNIIKSSPHGIALAGRPEPAPAIPASRIRIAHNRMEDLGRTARVIQISGIQGLTIENNIGFGFGANGFILHDEPNSQLLVQNNIFGVSPSFVASADGKGIGTEALNHHGGPNWVFRRNVVVGARPSAYPPENFYPPALDDLGLQEFPQDYQLTPTSKFFDPAQPPGPDPHKLKAATMNVVISQ